jgi:hypothetical protein
VTTSLRLDDRIDEGLRAGSFVRYLTGARRQVRADLEGEIVELVASG